MNLYEESSGLWPPPFIKEELDKSFSFIKGEGGALLALMEGFCFVVATEEDSSYRLTLNFPLLLSLVI